MPLQCTSRHRAGLLRGKEGLVEVPLYGLPSGFGLTPTPSLAALICEELGLTNMALSLLSRCNRPSGLCLLLTCDLFRETSVAQTLNDRPVVQGRKLGISVWLPAANACYGIHIWLQFDHLGQLSPCFP